MGVAGVIVPVLVIVVLALVVHIFLPLFGFATGDNQCS